MQGTMERPSAEAKVKGKKLLFRSEAAQRIRDEDIGGTADRGLEMEPEGKD